MKAVSKKLFLGVAGAAGLLLLLFAFAMTPPVQTWVARLALASKPELKAELGRIRLGWEHGTVEDIRVYFAGAVLTIPRLDAELPMKRAVLSQELIVSKLIARGWVLDLTGYAPAVEVAAMGPAQSKSFSLVSSAHAADPESMIRAVFQGVFAELQIPVDLSLDGVILEGTVVIPMGPGHPPAPVQVSLIGGGMKPGQEAVFTLNARLDLSDETLAVNRLELGGKFSAVMNTPRTFAKVAALLNTQASGVAFPQGAQLTTELSAAKVSGGENYTISLQSVGRRLLDIQANYPENSARLGGVWRLDMRDTDVAPFILGQPLPSFEAVGAGMFETDIMFLEVHTAGRIKSTADRMGAIVPALSDMGAATVFCEFNLTQKDQVIRVDKLAFDINQSAPVLGIQSLQAFEFNLESGELKVADPNADLLAIDALGLPVELVSPFLQGMAVRKGNILGRVVASARDGGVSLHTTIPLQLQNVTVASQSEKIAEALDVSLDLSAEYNPQGWQAIIDNLQMVSAGTGLMELNLKIGQLPGDAQPVIVTGMLKVSLPALLRQSMVGADLGLSRGELKADFSASLDGTQNIQGTLQLYDLVDLTGVVLPSIESKARASIDAARKINFHLPLVVARNLPQRVSDLMLSGTLEPTYPGYRVEARLDSGLMYLEDLEILMGLASALSGLAEPEQPSTTADNKPFWDGLSGFIELSLKKLFYNGQFEMNDVGGAIRIEAGTLKFTEVKAGVGESGSLRIDGEVGYNFQAPSPYDFKADMKMRRFDSAPLFRAIDTDNPPQIDGLFDLTSQLTAQGRTPRDLVSRTRGDIQLSSTGGVFRLLTAEVSDKVDNLGRVAAVGAFLGNVAGVLSKSKAPSGVANKAQAVAEFSKLISAIEYDQLNLSVSRDEELNTIFKDFTLIAPEVRLIGSGQLSGGSTLGILEQPMALAFEMKARGHTGEIMDYLNLLSAEKDDLGYAVCTLPLRVGGNLMQPDSTELQNALVKLAVEHSGAGDLLNRLLGK